MLEAATEAVASTAVAIGYYVGVPVAIVAGVAARYRRRVPGMTWRAAMSMAWASIDARLHGERDFSSTKGA